MRKLFQNWFKTLFWPRPLKGHNTVLLIEEMKKPVFPRSKLYYDTGKECPYPLCGLQRYVLKEGLVFRRVSVGINSYAYRACDPVTGAPIQISAILFHSLFTGTKVDNALS